MRNDQLSQRLRSLLGTIPVEVRVKSKGAPGTLTAIYNWTSLSFCDNHTVVTSRQASAGEKRSLAVDLWPHDFLSHSKRWPTWRGQEGTLTMKHSGRNRQDCAPWQASLRDRKVIWSFLLSPVCEIWDFLLEEFLDAFPSSFLYGTKWHLLGHQHKPHISCVQNYEQMRWLLYCDLILAHFMGQLDQGAGVWFIHCSLSVCLSSVYREWD